MAICIGLAAVTQLKDERGALLASLLAEQSRLRNLADTMEDDLIQADADLRIRAKVLLEPTIAEIQAMLDGELSPAEATRAAAHISASVNEVIRPASRVLAVPPSIKVSALRPVEPAPLDVIRDRMDAPAAIRPTLVLLITWLTIIPAPLLFWGERGSAVRVGLIASLVFWVLMQVTRRVWPQRWRSITIVRGLTVLLALYLGVNLVFQIVLTHVVEDTPIAAAWLAVSPFGFALRVAIAMIVSVLAMLDEHGRQSRTRLAEVNNELEEKIAQLRRQTWLMHRTVALVVHGPVQSALVSTAMRLAAADRTHASVQDARRRLDVALAELRQHSDDDVSIELALEDLRALWQGIVRIDVNIDAHAHELLAGDVGLRRCVLEVCRESASNAIRHGQARLVAINLAAPNGRIEVRVSDDGVGLGQSVTPGLGTAMLEDTCLRWNLRNASGEGAELTATLV